jgi:hypothetical protein
MAMTNWRTFLIKELKDNNETFDDIESNTMTSHDMDKMFYSGYGSANGCQFTVWTKKRVYFPVVYDGSEWIGSVSRHPDGNPTKHQGGQ